MKDDTGKKRRFLIWIQLIQLQFFLHYRFQPPPVWRVLFTQVLAVFCKNFSGNQVHMTRPTDLHKYIWTYNTFWWSSLYIMLWKPLTLKLVKMKIPVNNRAGSSCLYWERFCLFVRRWLVITCRIQNFSDLKEYSYLKSFMA